MDSRAVTILTPTTGRPSLLTLIDSVDRQIGSGPITHLLLWDDKREPEAPEPESLECSHRWSLVMPGGFGKMGNAPGSALRALGLIAAVTPWVTFADDDVHWDSDHLASLLTAASGRRWSSTLRRVWASPTEMLGIDRFESVGDDPARRVPYEMLDNNCMLFRRELGSQAAALYRETIEYNDDRLMYAHLKVRAGVRGVTGRATVNQICPPRLTEFFRKNCSIA